MPSSVTNLSLSGQREEFLRTRGVHLKALLCNGRTDSREQILGAGIEFLPHFLYGSFCHAVHRAAPTGVRKPNGVMNGVIE